MYFREWDRCDSREAIFLERASDLLLSASDSFLTCVCGKGKPKPCSTRQWIKTRDNVGNQMLPQDFLKLQKVSWIFTLLFFDTINTIWYPRYGSFQHFLEEYLFNLWRLSFRVQTHTPSPFPYSEAEEDQAQKRGWNVLLLLWRRFLPSLIRGRLRQRWDQRGRRNSLLSFPRSRQHLGESFIPFEFKTKYCR